MITTNELTKAYGGHLTVNRVSLQARPGRVTGFLGPNGAGKSTTMRIMVGLTPATAGTATIEGHRFTDLPNPGSEVGVLLDASAQHAGRTGREILTLAQRTMGVPRSRIQEMLDLVSLTAEEADRRDSSVGHSGGWVMDSASGDPVGAVTWMIRGQWVTLSIRAAVELGVFDRLYPFDRPPTPTEAPRPFPCRARGAPVAATLTPA